VAKVLLGDEVPDLPPMEASDIAVEVVYQLAKIHSKYWKNIDVRACEPLLGEKS
jgi:histone deacetylase 6